MHKPRQIRRVWGCERGAAAVEFALIAPVFFLLIFGIVEFSLMMFASNALESAVTNSARTGKTGFVEAGLSREDTILNMIKSHVDGVMDTDLLSINTKVYSNLTDINDPEPFTDTNLNGVRDSSEAYTDTNGNGQWDSDMAMAGLGTAGDVVVYTVSYPWTIATPLLNHMLSDTGIITLSSSIVVRNEPWDAVSFSN